MGRAEDWEDEVRDALRTEDWALTGPRRLIKVVALPHVAAGSLRGFVGLEKVLIGKTPHQIERTLGLPSNVLRSGCRVYRFKRLPMSHEVDYELDARHPDGLAFDPATLDEARAQRRQAPAKPRVKVYPPGAAHVHQWKLLVDLPVAPVLDLLPGERYPYLH